VGIQPSHRRRTGGDVGLIAAAAVLCALAAAITVTGPTADHAWLEATARALMVGAPIAVGIYARGRASSARFGSLLVLTGLAWFLTTLAESGEPALHAIGRMSGWLVEPLLVLLVLSFPTGRLRAPADRALVLSVLAAVIALYLPSVLLVERFPEPSPWSACSGGCPHNPLMILGSEPAWVDDVLRPIRELLTVALFAAVCVRLAMRLAASSRLMRRTLEPVMVVALVRFASFAALIVLRLTAPGSGFLEAAVWVLSLTVPLLAAAFLLGLARWHLFIADAVQHLAGRMTHHPGPEDLRSALAETFEDPTLEIVYPNGNGWRESSGAPVTPPPPGSGRALTEVRDDGLVIAGIVHDDTLAEEEAFVDAARAYAVLTLDNRRLGAEAAALLDEVRDSRSRIQASADEERRRVERDLHDGAQQRLVALRIKLVLAAERIDADDHRSAEIIRALGADVDGALDEIRSLARGIFPSPLADRGLAEALRSAAMQAVLPATVVADNTRERYSRPVESAAYFCCLEAMQNAAKHATRATQLVIELTDNGTLQFSVQDDGEGFDAVATPPGFGLTSMRDRLAAVGGELQIVSSAAHGTRVIGRIPLDRPLPRLAPSRRFERDGRSG
jgi:signal transduction histidine kinase